MAHKCETPRIGGASRNGCGGSFHDVYSSTEAQVQYLKARLGLSPNRAQIIAPHVFGEEVRRYG